MSAAASASSGGAIEAATNGMASVTIEEQIKPEEVMDAASRSKAASIVVASQAVTFDSLDLYVLLSVLQLCISLFVKILLIHHLSILCLPTGLTFF